MASAPTSAINLSSWPGATLPGWRFTAPSGLTAAGNRSSALGLATAQRNIGAALVVAASLSGDIIVLTLVGALLIPIGLVILAGELGKRVAAAAGSSAADPGPAS